MEAHWGHGNRKLTPIRGNNPSGTHISYSVLSNGSPSGAKIEAATFRKRPRVSNGELTLSSPQGEFGHEGCHSASDDCRRLLAVSPPLNRAIGSRSSGKGLPPPYQAGAASNLFDKPQLSSQ